MLTLQHASQLFHHLRLRNSRSSRQSLLERDLGDEDHLLDHVLEEQLPEEQTASTICFTRTTRTCTVGTLCSKSLEACRGTQASGSRIPPTSSQSNKSKDAGWEGRVFRTLTTYFTCSLPPRSWPSSVPVGAVVVVRRRRSGMATETTRRVSISILLKHLCGKILLFEPACGIDDLRSLLLRLRGRPTFRDIACARLASANCTRLPLKNAKLVTRTSILVSRWLSVLWSRLVALSLSLELKEHCCGSENLTTPHCSAHDETLKHARTTRWCELGLVFPCQQALPLCR